MSKKDQSDSNVNTIEAGSISFAEFLETIPPNQERIISDLCADRSINNEIRCPEIQLHCTSDKCNGTRIFRCSKTIYLDPEGTNFFMTFLCSNCRSMSKTYSLIAISDRLEIHGNCMKYGEDPTFGPPTPARLISLIGSDRNIFLKGRSSENHGLGVGAFSYYRRVIQNQKNRILDEIIKVSERIHARPEVIKKLQDAKKETQFSKAINDVKDAIPESLLINGKNPLTLLYGALSDGIHDKTDEQCLEIASGVRVVLSELAEKISQTLKDEAELKHAINRLQQLKSNPVMKQSD